MDFQSLVTLAPWTIIAQICNLILQMFLFKKFLFKPIQDIIARRQQEVDAIYDDADKARADADAAREEYESHLLSARQEAGAITAKAMSDARERSDRLVEDARKEASDLREQASRDIELERRKAMQEARGEISDLAVELASKLVRREISKEDHEQLMAQFIDELGDGV